MTDARFVFEPNLYLVDADAFFARDFLQAGYAMEWPAPSGVVGLTKAQTGGTNHDGSVLGIVLGKNVCRVVGFDETGAVVLPDRVPDARTIWLFREKLTKAEAIGPLFEHFDAPLREAGHVAMSGQIVDASLIAAPRQRNTQDEKQAIREGRIRTVGRTSPRSCGRKIATRAGR